MLTKRPKKSPPFAPLEGGACPACERNIFGDRHIYLTKYIFLLLPPSFPFSPSLSLFPRLHYAPNKNPAALCPRVNQPDCNPRQCFFSPSLVLAAKRVVPPVLEFFRSFFAEEERESTGRTRQRGGGRGRKRRRRRQRRRRKGRRRERRRVRPTAGRY